MDDSGFLVPEASTDQTDPPAQRVDAGKEQAQDRSPAYIWPSQRLRRLYNSLARLRGRLVKGHAMRAVAGQQFQARSGKSCAGRYQQERAWELANRWD